MITVRSKVSGSYCLLLFAGIDLRQLLSIVVDEVRNITCPIGDLISAAESISANVEAKSLMVGQ